MEKLIASPHLRRMASCLAIGLCLSATPSSAIEMNSPPAVSKQGKIVSAQNTIPTVTSKKFIEDLKRIIALGDLRNIEGFEQTFQVPIILEPQTFHRDGHDYAVWIKMVPKDDTGLALPPFEYVVAIQDAIKWRPPESVLIAKLDFNGLQNVVCITKDAIRHSFSNAFEEGSGIHGILHGMDAQVLSNKDFSMHMIVEFDGDENCAFLVTFTQIRDNATPQAPVR